MCNCILYVMSLQQYIEYQMQARQGQGYPLYIKGDIKIIDRIKLTLSITISFPKQLQILVPFVARSKQITPLLDPVIHLETINDATREQVMKGKYVLQPGTFYIYYPSEFRVDEKIYKSLLKNYENLVDEVHRSIKPNLHRLIIWQQGKGDNSVEIQKLKINEALSEIARLASFTHEIRQYQSQPSTPKSLLHIFMLKNKLACLYSHLSLKNFAYELLSDLWNQMMINFRCLMKLTSNTKLGSQKLEVPQDIPKSPYSFQNTNDILGYFQTAHSTAYLRIVTHSFLKFYCFSLSLGLCFQALSKLKNCLDYILNNVLVLARRNEWTKQEMMQFDISRNLWVIQVATKCLKQFETVYDKQQNKEHQNLSKVHISICSMLRNSVERVGLTLYQFDNYSIFPSTIEKQIAFVFHKISKVKEPWRNNKVSIESLDEDAKEELVQKSASLMRRQQFIIQIPENGPGELKLRQLISEKMHPTQQIAKLLINFQAYSQVYLNVLQQMFMSLKDSPFGRVAKSLKLTVERATLMLGDWQDYQRVQDEPEQFRDHWPELHAIQQLYRLFFLFVKLLAGQVNIKSTISEQLVKILTNQLLRKQQNIMLSIAGLVHQIFVLYDVTINAATISSLSLSEEMEITIIVPRPNLYLLLKQASKWRIVTQQIMLSEGEKVYELGNVEFRQYKKCHKCPKQCSKLCTQPKELLTEIKAKIILEDRKELSLFYIKSIAFEIAPTTIESPIHIKLVVPQSQKTKLQKINAPKLIPINDKQCPIYSETWSPVTIKLTNVKEATQLLKINVKIQSALAILNENKQENKSSSHLQVSNLVCVKIRKSKKRSQNQNDKKYFRLGEQLELHLNESSRMSLTIFVKGGRPEQIQRNSKRMKQEVTINQLLKIEVLLKSSRMNKTYTIEQRTPNIIIKPLILLQYHIVQTCQQFTITNLRDLTLQIADKKDGEEDSNNVVCLLEKNQSFGTESRLISVAVAKYKKMKVLINLNDWFESDHLLQQKCNTFRIWYQFQYSYSVLKPIQIESELVGQLQIPYADECFEQGYELVGKTKGLTEYTCNKSINLWLVPIRSGNIILPQIWVNGKRGIWVNSLITNVQAC